MSSNSSTSLGIPDDLSMPQQPVLDDTSPIIQRTRYLAQSTGPFPLLIYVSLVVPTDLLVLELPVTMICSSVSG